MKDLSLILLMAFQLCFVIIGILALYRIMKQKSRHLDLLQTAIGLCAATQFNINLTRMRYGAVASNYHDSWDWVLSNYLGAACFLFLLVVVIKTGAALK